MDLGDSPYAATCHIDARNRPILWVWLRETRPESLPAKVVCGCLGVPRHLSYLPHPKKSLLFQAPIPEIAQLRGRELWTSSSEPDSVDGKRKIQGVTRLCLRREATGHIDAEMVLQRCAPSCSYTETPGAHEIYSGNICIHEIYSKGGYIIEPTTPRMQPSTPRNPSNHPVHRAISAGNQRPHRTRARSHEQGGASALRRFICPVALTILGQTSSSRENVQGLSRIVVSSSHKRESK